ncbi:MAG: ATP-binding cassette domain-containing protein [Thermomicrobium sp.]|nr:ATP-binding cassette domain-containing protein [Thermomicrobium sp.]
MNAQSSESPVVDVRDLHVDYRSGRLWLRVLHGISLQIGRCETYGLVGESGCGKSTLAAAMAGYLSRNGRIARGHIILSGREVTHFSRRQWQRLWKDQVAVVLQNPGSGLNPRLTVETHLREAFAAVGQQGEAARAAMLELLERLHFRDPEQVLRRYPGQLSGGMQQRVMLATALARNPRLLVLDEPTSGLDVTLAASLMELIAEVQTSWETAILLISHDLRLVLRVCHRIGVLYAGRLVEEAAAPTLAEQPAHPYTASLLHCLPRLGQRKELEPLVNLPGDPLPAWQSTPGCPFAPRCSHAAEPCQQVAPPQVDLGAGHVAWCHFAREFAQTGSLSQRAGPIASGPTVSPGSRFAREAPLLRLDRVTKRYVADAAPAVQEVSLELQVGETIGLMGE